MKNVPIIALLAVPASTVLGAACNADNVLRALRANSASASPFCSTYTLPPPNQPLPTYVSAYPASRVSSACSCLITPTLTTSMTASTTAISTSSTTSPATLTSSTSQTLSSTTTTSTTASPNPTDYVCTGDLIRNGGFQTLNNGKPDPWIFDPATNLGSGQYTNTFLGTSPGGNNQAYLSVTNGQFLAYGSTYIEQYIPTLCYDVEYNLTYSSQITITGGQPGMACSVSYSLASIGELVHIGPPNGDQQPWSYQTRSYTFTYGKSTGGNGGGDKLTVWLSCNAPGGSYVIDDVSLVGLQDPGYGG
ncbi:MAG: hypothetical protein L6R39_004061 [Caloplaca ligustica]|nr:MAG: hypothetical protein L6R39_004061 [Caloplaca ligustica]